MGGRGQPARPPSWVAGGEDWRAHLNGDVGYLRGPAWGGGARRSSAGLSDRPDRSAGLERIATLASSQIGTLRWG